MRYHLLKFWGIVMLFAMLTIPTLAQDNTTHVIQSGENLFRIALRYGVDMDELARANGITDPKRIFAGQVLNIPGLTPVTNAEQTNNPLVTTAPIVHTVQRGESLAMIARQYGVTVQQILSGNDIANPNRIFAGQQINVWGNELSVPITDAPPPATPAPIAEAPAPEPPAPSDSDIFHTVVRGEYLSRIAQRYGVSWTSIAEANGITDPNRIYAGLRLRIPNGTAGSGGGGTVSNGNEPGAYVGTGREIVVILSQQMTYAYENGVLQRAALVSTGLPATPTVRGNYKIYLRYRTQNMSGPGYFLRDVPFVMYFYKGYGLHGTYWHSNFGQPMSRGCVNMNNEDAEWFYNFADIGTPVHVRWA